MVVDSSRFLQLGQRHLVWVVAIAASTEAFVQGIIGLLDRRITHFVLWLVAYFLIMAFAALAERVKLGGAE